MAPERFRGPRKETRESLNSSEILSPDQLRWFAGAFEVGGSMGIGVNTKGETSPYMRIHEADEQLMDFLKSRFGGTKVPVGNSFLWALSGYKAAEIMAAMQPHTVLRSEQCTGAYNWLHALTPDERVQIAQELKTSDGPIEEMTPEQHAALVNRYKTLVQDSAFLAGIIDHRGTIMANKKTEVATTVIVAVRSTNSALIEALATVLQGTTILLLTKGTVNKIKGKEFISKKDSWRWSIEAAQARAVIALALPQLKVPPFDGWDTLYTDKVEVVRQDNIEILASLIKGEIAAFKKGDIDKLKTLPELAELFDMKPPTLRNYLIALPKALRKERESLLRQFHKRALPRADVDLLVEMITTEVRDLKAGSRDNVTSAEEWAALMSVKKQTINTCVLRALKPEVYNERKSFIRSEIAKRRNAAHGNPSSRR